VSGKVLTFNNTFFEEGSHEKLIEHVRHPDQPHSREICLYARHAGYVGSGRWRSI
jgi:hypothetical protein